MMTVLYTIVKKKSNDVILFQSSEYKPLSRDIIRPFISPVIRSESDDECILITTHCGKLSGT